jgi:hypothetical protein
LPSISPQKELAAQLHGTNQSHLKRSMSAPSCPEFI